MLKARDTQEDLRTGNVKDGRNNSRPVMPGQSPHEHKYGGCRRGNNRERSDLDPCRVTEEVIKQRSEKERESAEEIRSVALPLQKIRSPPSNAPAAEHAPEFVSEAPDITIKLLLRRGLTQPAESQRKAINCNKRCERKNRRVKAIGLHCLWLGGGLHWSRRTHHERALSTSNCARSSPVGQEELPAGEQMVSRPETGIGRKTAFPASGSSATTPPTTEDRLAAR